MSMLHEESFIGYSSSNIGGVNGSNTDTMLKNSYRLLILGAPKVGKTSIINWFLGKPYRDSYIPTIEDFHRKIYKIRGEIYRLDILDTSGNDPFPAMKKLNIMIGDLFVLVFSLDDIDSYVQVKSLCEQIIETKKQKHLHHHHHQKLNIPILIIGNKLDYIMDNKIQERCVDTSEIDKYLQSTPALRQTAVYFETSCKNNLNLDRAFEKYFYQCNLPIEMIPSKHRKVSLNLDLTKPQFTTSRRVHQRTIEESTDTENENPSTMTTNGGGLDTTESSNNVAFNSRKSFKFKRANAMHVKQQDSTTTDNENNNNNNEDGETRNSFKNYARKSFRKMTFRRQLTEACGAVWLNARRPSIRAELNLLKIKTNLNFHLPTTNINCQNGSRRRSMFGNLVSKLLCCTRRGEGGEDSLSAANEHSRIDNNQNNRNKGRKEQE